MVGTTVSHYKILEKLGEGGMGVVYKAHDSKLNRDIALKFLPHQVAANEAEQARFLQEAQAVAALNQPNICTIHDIQEFDGQQFIVMEYVEGKTLREMLPIKKTADAITYAIQIAEALQEAHCHGIVHRDIKADNIMVNQKNQVKVMDFGLAKLKGSLHLTKTSSTIGTLAYMAPEQIEGGEVDARSDIFSFGIVLYEMLTGHLPFRGEHEAAMVYSIVNEAPAPLQHYLPDAPSKLLHILDRALEKDREDRYQMVQEMLIDLRRLKKDSTRVTRHLSSGAVTVETRPTMAATEGKGSKRKTTWIAIGALTALVAVALSVVLLRKPEARLNSNRTSILVNLPFRNVLYPSISSDGKLMAYPVMGEDGTFDMYMMNTAPGSAPHRVTDEREGFIDDCDISPDLSLIVYTTRDAAGGRFSVKVVPTEGGKARTLADTGVIVHWTPDGKRVSFMRMGMGNEWTPSASGHLEIWSMRPDGSDRRLELMDTVGINGAASYCWSPDEASIAWVRNYSRNACEVMVRELATGREQELTHDKKKVDEVIWATNGQILFISNKSGQSNLWMIPSGGGEATQITQGTAPILSARISIDTKKILFYQIEDIRQIWTSSTDGSHARQVTMDDVLTKSCAFSPDGRSIVAGIGSIDQLNSGTSLYVMDREGKNRQVIATGTNIGPAVWSADGRWLAYEDSGRVFLVEPANPGTPRHLCEGSPIGWMETGDLIVWRETKSFQYSLSTGLVRQLSIDSVVVLALYGGNRICYFDIRKGRKGRWSGTLDSLGHEPANPRMVTSFDSAPNTVMSAEMQFAVFQKSSVPWNGIWRVSLATGKVEQIGMVPAPWMWLMDLARDGKELLWIKYDARAKLSMIENPFE